MESTSYHVSLEFEKYFDHVYKDQGVPDDAKLELKKSFFMGYQACIARSARVDGFISNQISEYFKSVRDK